jgi:G:T-mismatch repair DNA endonuclease (very short patch repair protein)
MILCPLCNKNFKDRRSFRGHCTKTEKINFINDIDFEKFIVETIYGKEIVDESIVNYTAEKVCVYELTIDIAKYLKLLKIKRSSKEERKTERYKNKYTKSIQEKYGDGITNISQITEVKEKKKITFTEKFGSYENYIIFKLEELRKGYNLYQKDPKKKEIAYSKYIATCVAKYGVENVSQIPEVRKVKSEKSKQFFQNMTAKERLEYTAKARASVCSRGGYSSSIEKRVAKCLIDLDIQYKANINLWNYNWDLVFNNIIIEVQGDMWHGNPNFYKSTDLIMNKLLVKDIWKKDGRKRKKAIENGYKVLYIWEYDIRKKTDFELVEYVSSMLKE